MRQPSPHIKNTTNYAISAMEFLNTIGNPALVSNTTFVKKHHTKTTFSHILWCYICLTFYYSYFSLLGGCLLRPLVFFACAEIFFLEYVPSPQTVFYFKINWTYLKSRNYNWQNLYQEKSSFPTCIVNVVCERNSVSTFLVKILSAISYLNLQPFNPTKKNG